MNSFIEEYGKASNASSGSKFDANANVSSKNISTLMGEYPKGLFIELNREMMVEKLEEMFPGEEMGLKYKLYLDNHILYKNDETNIANYCASITMYPWLLNGTKPLGGSSTAPTNLKSFTGGFINLVFMVSSQLAGAVATPEFLMYMDYFLRQEYGFNYHQRFNEVVDLSLKQRTLGKVIDECFEQIVYSLNQPTGARNYQAVFWNISYYDEFYFNSLFENFKFPDGSEPCWKSTSALQKRFMNWFNEERTKAVLTFPVETMAMLVDEDGVPKDKDWFDFSSLMYSKGHSFFTYLSDSADSLSSCCRLRNEITDNSFSYTLGAGGISTGSKSVLTMNVNRAIQYAVNSGVNYLKYLNQVVYDMHRFQLAYNANLMHLKELGLLPLFDEGYIHLNRQYLTIGVNGLVEGAEFLGIEITDNPEYEKYVNGVLDIIKEHNIEMKKSTGVMFNCEMIPAENVGVKFAKWDKKDGYVVPREVYNSYFYIVESNKYTILDKIKLHGRRYIANLTGGSALHLNLEEHLTQDQYKKVICCAGKEGCNYFTFNIPNTICNECGHISKNRLKKCCNCGSENLDYITRIIGYLKRVSNFSEKRQEEEKRRYYIK